MAIAHPIDWKWYNVSEYIQGHSTKPPKPDEFVYYIKKLQELHAEKIKELELELQDLRILKTILKKL